jgi:eukaryotic-like serine/threonine-protein kinase
MEPDHDRIETILVTAVEIQSENERQEYVRQACAGDAVLQSRVAALIENHFKAGSFLNSRDQPKRGVNDVQEFVGSMIGPYKLLQKLGEGGMGVVYMAEQQQPFHRRVALKVIRAGMDSAQVVARFEHERQALALMDHPNIARVLDAGVTSTGQPYFAMELVQGIPITKYCDQEALTLEDRLRLFVSVCRAVQHAHQKGIIHRDLKPSNVIVGLYDGQPIPKVIDFGVAKATGQRLIEQTMFTEVGQIIGTIEYMAPEQAEMNNLDVDTRADIYSLGVLLYELLTGSPPFAAQTLRRAGLGEMLRMIKEVEPTKPSTKITSADDLPRVAANRRLEPARLARSIRGELDWITMKCLEKTRTRRYETANGLAQDIERFLADEQVQAGPPGTGYRMRKFLWRNRGLVAAGTLLLLTLIGGVVGTSIGLFRAAQGQAAAIRALQIAQQQRDRAERHYQRAMSAVDRLLTRVGVVQLESVPQMDETRRRILEDAVEFFREILQDESDDPVARREFGLAWQRVGDIQTLLSQSREAEESLNRAIVIQQKLASEFLDEPKYDTDFVRSHRQLAFVLFRSGRIPEAEQIVKTMLSRPSTAMSDNRSELSLLHYLRGMICASTQRMDEAISSCTESLALTDGMDRSDSASFNFMLDRASVLSFLGNLYRLERRLNEAEKCQLEAKLLLEQLLTNEPENVGVQNRLAALYTNLGLTYANLNRQAEAEAINGKAIATLESLSRNHPKVPNYKFDLAKTSNNIALLHSKHADPSRALAENEKALRIFEELKTGYPHRPEFASSYAGACANQAKYLIELDRLEESLDWNAKAIDAAAELLKAEPRHSETRRMLHNSLIGRAGTYRRLKQIELAIKDYRRSLELSAGETHVNYVNFRPRALAFVGDYKQAASAAEAIVTGTNATGSNFSEMASVYATCVEAASRDTTLADAERVEMAEHYAVRSVELLAKAAEKGHFTTLEDVSDLRSDDRLQPIQYRDDFKQLLLNLEKSIQSQPTSDAGNPDR